MVTKTISTALDVTAINLLPFTLHLEFCDVSDHTAKNEEVERQNGIPIQSAP
jgi:hypothetical protein